MARKGLGRGLEALLDYRQEPSAHQPPPNSENPEQTGGVVAIDIRKIEPNKQQPRTYFDDAALQELAESIKRFGIIQPLIVRDSGGFYTIIAGERRFRAARMAKMETVPAIIKDYSELETLQIALIENIQRQDLTPIEEAVCYKRLMEDFFFTQEDIAEKIGKNRNAISNTVRLLELDDRVQHFVSEGKLTASHARALLAIKDGDWQLQCAEHIIAEALSVRGAESFIMAALNEAAAEENDEMDALSAPEPTDAAALESAQQAALLAYRKVEEELQMLLGAKVNIHYGKRKGKIEIAYDSQDELDRLIGLFKLSRADEI